MTKKCPHCGANGAATILYGTPDFNEELEAAMKNGEVFVGGCCITGDDPKYKCRSCGFEYGRSGGDPAQSDFEIVSDMYELYEPDYPMLDEAAEALRSAEAARLFFEYGGKAYIIDAADGYRIQIPEIDFEDIGWRGSRTTAGPFETFEELVAAITIDGKSLAGIADAIPRGFYKGW